MSISDDLQEEINKSRLGRISELLEKSGIDVAEIGKVDKVKISEWQGLIKNDEGVAELHDLGGISMVLSPKWESGPEWNPVHQGPSIKLPKPSVRTTSSNWKT